MTDILWTSRELAQILSAIIRQDFAITGIAIDSRSLRPGDLFIALRGDNFDGHDFIAMARKNGAIAAIVSRVPSDIATDFPLIIVPDTMAALVQIAKAARQRFRGKLIGITGSVGKTGTKEMLKTALGDLGKTYATEGNLNNHIGVPLSLARLPRDCEFAVIEMGMNHPGEIGPLSVLCEPYVGIITAIAPAHIEFFPTGLVGIADEKAEITAGMGPHSVAIFNRDTPHYDRLVHTAQNRAIGRIIGFGEDGAAQARLVACQILLQQTAVTADILGQILDYKIGAVGKHHALNSLAVLAAVQAVGADIHRAAAALVHFQPPAGRGLRRDLTLAQGTVTVIDETYNASPEAMRAALAVLAEAQPAPGGRRIAVLGDMRELGQHGPSLHRDLAASVLAAKPEQVFLCGPLMQNLAQALDGKLPVTHAACAASLAPLVAASLRAHDIALIKGSLGSKMRIIVEYLVASG